MHRGARGPGESGVGRSVAVAFGGDVDRSARRCKHWARMCSGYSAVSGWCGVLGIGKLGVGQVDYYLGVAPGWDLTFSALPNSRCGRRHTDRLPLGRACRQAADFFGLSVFQYR